MADDGICILMDAQSKCSMGPKEVEAPKVSTKVVNGEGYLPPQPIRGSVGASLSSPAGSGAKPRPKMNLAHF